MFSKIRPEKYRSDPWDNLKSALEEADTVLVGAGSGLSYSAGLTWSGERFNRYFSDFEKKYGISDMNLGCQYPFETREEYWAWWSRIIYYNRYDKIAEKPYTDLLKLIQGKEYFVLTTNADHQFIRAGFDRSRIFYTEGDYGLWQCSEPCHKATYDNEAAVRRMVDEQKDMKIPSDLVPLCPLCGKPMAMNLRFDSSFVQDEGWYAAAKRYEDFVGKHKKGQILLLELGVGDGSHTVIRHPFWQLTLMNRHAIYACINLGEARTHHQIKNRSICIDGDIGEVLAAMK